MDPDLERRAFLQQKYPAEYQKVKPLVDEFAAWVNDPANQTPTDKVAGKRVLVGLEDPEGHTPFPKLVATVERAIKSARHDPTNAAAHFMLARAITELSRFDDETYHPRSLRDAVDFAEKSRELAPKVGKAWSALIEIYIHLKRDEMVTEMLRELNERGFAPGTHAQLSAKFAESQGNYEDAIQWYERAMGYIAQAPRRAESYAAQAACYIKMNRRSEAERPFMMALLEGGPNPWIGHNWSVLKFDLGNLAGATELNRRVLQWDVDYPPANDFKNYLIGVWQKRNEPYPGPIALQEEKLRGIVLPACDAAVREKLGVEEWRPPRRGTRARATRTFRSGLE